MGPGDTELWEEEEEGEVAEEDSSRGELWLELRTAGLTEWRVLREGQIRENMSRLSQKIYPRKIVHILYSIIFAIILLLLQKKQ